MSQEENKVTQKDNEPKFQSYHKFSLIPKTARLQTVRQSAVVRKLSSDNPSSAITSEINEENEGEETSSSHTSESSSEFDINKSVHTSKDNTIPNESREEIKTQEKGKTSASTKENKGVINSLFNISESRSAKQSKRLRQEIIQHKALARQFLYATHRQSEPNKCKTDDGEVKEPKATKKF